MKKIVIVFVCIFIVLGVLPKGALATENEYFTENSDLAFFWYDFADRYLGEIRKAINEELADKGIPYIHFNAKCSQSTQNEQIDTAIENGAKLLVVNIVDTASTYAAQLIAEKAEAADIPVIFFNREMEDKVIDSYNNACFVGVRAAEAGEKQGILAGKYIVENYDEIDLNGDGKISYIMMKGELGNPEAEVRGAASVEFCNEELVKAGKPMLTYFDPDNIDLFQSANWSKNQAFEHMEIALNLYPFSCPNPIEVVFANNDEMALGCIEALNNAGWNKGQGNLIPVFGLDRTFDAMEAMQAGKMTGSVMAPIDGYAETILSLIGNVASYKNLFANARDNFNVDDGVAKIRVPYVMYLKGEVFEVNDEKNDDIEAPGGCNGNTDSDNNTGTEDSGDFDGTGTEDNGEADNGTGTENNGETENNVESNNSTENEDNGELNSNNNTSSTGNNKTNTDKNDNKKENRKEATNSDDTKKKNEGSKTETNTDKTPESLPIAAEQLSVITKAGEAAVTDNVEENDEDMSEIELQAIIVSVLRGLGIGIACVVLVLGVALGVHILNKRINGKSKEE